MFMILLSIGALFAILLYYLILEARFAEQEAKIYINDVFRRLGLDEPYSLNEITKLDTKPRFKRKRMRTLTEPIEKSIIDFAGIRYDRLIKLSKVEENESKSANESGGGGG